MQNMKKIMFVGPVGVGKTTLTQRLKGLELSYFKTQAIEFYDAIIDTPGEFLQHRKYYNALNVTATEAECDWSLGGGFQSDADLSSRLFLPSSIKK